MLRIIVLWTITVFPIILNTANCNARIICEDLIYFLTSSDNDVPFHIILVNKELTYLDIYEKLNRSIKGNRKTLIIVDNFIQTKVMEYLFSAVDKSILDAHFWLFLQRLNETSPNGFETVEQLLEKKLDLSSNIFTLLEIQNVEFFQRFTRNAQANQQLHPL